MRNIQFAIPIDDAAIRRFCRKWRIRELSLFGSVLHPEEFRADSNVDVLVTLDDPHRAWGPWLARWSEMHEEIERILGRKVDLVEKRRLENPFIRHSVLTTRQVIYAS